MQEAQSRPKFYLPVLIDFQLRNFSLYSRQESIELNFGNGVFCLAGANGLGKSTFISILNYALTGAVPLPNRPFKSADEYYKLSIEFSKLFFDGRVAEDDRENAEVRLSFKVQNSRFEVTRGFFETEEIRDLQIVDGNSTLQAGSLSPAERHQLFATTLAAKIGAESFQQFVFLQHFVFTFDEGRHLLFWDQTALEHALYLAFGVDVKSAQRAEALRREAEKADSRARNLNWQATQARKKLRDLESAVELEEESEDKYKELRTFHQDFMKRRDDAEAKLGKLHSNISDVELQVATASAKQVSLRSEYESEYAKYLRGKIQISRHPLVSALLNGGPCELCGTESQAASAHVTSRLESHRCPLCDSPLAEKTVKPSARLQSLDKQLTETARSLDEGLKKRERLTKDSAEAENALSKLSREMAAFEAENANVLNRLAAARDGTGVDTAMTRYREQVAELLARKRQELTRRDEARKQLRTLQKSLVTKYSEAEERFAPLFRDLANLFLGLDLDIRLETTSGAGLTLILEVKSTVRRELFQMSESQRFFVDIALRMALLQFMAAEQSGALFVDTPEGSLDIAYENRAGSMFAAFAKRHFMLIMTANINTSRLLLELAEQCGPDLMTLSRMTNWTDLSEVQVAEEKRFNEAFTAIQSALQSSPPTGKKPLG